ncbi:Hsp70-Hsp90 organizing protein 2 [Cardamine amara subsp. amara]|uniref:Hsp70-Hsp90 organizing protein 2 n=1 Tax=Cardamine amara subsp. amara TaxID=228776 RepID=A0ABD1A792_CARAN
MASVALPALSCRSSGEQVKELRVCTNRTCRKQGSFQILETLTALAPPQLRVTPCACLGRCGSGPNLMALPQGLLLRHCATPSRAAEILFSLCCDGREASSSYAVTDALAALALTNNALSQIDAGNLSEAEALLTQALELKPYGGLHRIFKHRSVAKLGMLDYSGALEDISRALALDPNYAEPYLCQGDVYVAKGQYDLAEKSYLKCLEIDPSLRRSKSFKARIANLQKKVVELDVT